MNTPDPTTPTNPTDIPHDSARFNGMELSEAEAALHAQPIDDFDPATTPAPAAVVEAPAPAPAPDATPVAADPVPAASAAPAPAPAQPPPAPLFAEAPVAPRDFIKDAADLRAKFDAGDITTEEFVEQSNTITVEQARFEAQNTIYQAEQKRVAELQQAAKAAADEAWNTEVIAWQTANADFMSNPLRKNAMAEAIKAIDEQTGYQLSPRELLAKAADVAFDAYGWKKPTENAVRDATAARAPDLRGVPTNLGAAPAAGSEDIRGNEAFAALDRLDADQLEDALARLPAAQREAYLADAPGARSTGRD